MIAVALVQRAHDLGLHLESRNGGWLAVRPSSKLPPDLADDLRRHKSEVLTLLEGPTMALRKEWRAVPPLDLPLAPLKPSPTPVRRELVIAYLSRQCDHLPLREWLTRRKAAYFDTIAKTWDCGLLAYAVARDAACWQSDRTEADVWSLLEGIESALEDFKSKQVGKAGTHPQ